MPRPLIGVTSYPPNAAGRYNLPSEYVAAVRRAGGEPILLPPSAPGETPDHAPLLDRLAGLVLTGGGDIDAAAWGEPLHPEVYAVYPERDRDETALVHAVLARRMPTLAICRGAQILNVALGGSLHQHLPDVVDGSVVHRRDEAVKRGEPGNIPHPVTVDADSLVARIMGTTSPTIESWHHQAVNVLGTGLRVVAEAADGIVEAIEHDTHPWLAAVQWHPEISAATDPTQQQLFDAFVAASATYSEGNS